MRMPRYVEWLLGFVLGWMYTEFRKGWKSTGVQTVAPGNHVHRLPEAADD